MRLNESHPWILGEPSLEYQASLSEMRFAANEAALHKCLLLFIYLFILTHVLVHRQHPLSQDVYSNAYKIDRFRDWDLFTPSLT